MSGVKRRFFPPYLFDVPGAGADECHCVARLCGGDNEGGGGGVDADGPGGFHGVRSVNRAVEVVLSTIVIINFNVLQRNTKK